MRTFPISLCLGMSLFACSLNAANLGVYGQVYPIAEIDLSEFIHQRLEQMQASGQLNAMENTFKQNVIAHTLRPPKVKGLTTVGRLETHYYSPTFTLPEDVYDSQGKLLYPAGTTVNALALPKSLFEGRGLLARPDSGTSTIQLNEAMIFINADDPNQIAFAKEAVQYYSDLNTIIILVEGNIVDAGHALGRIYFDQYGLITQKLGITHIPAVVTQAGTQLKIDEYPDSDFPLKKAVETTQKAEKAENVKEAV